MITSFFKRLSRRFRGRERTPAEFQALFDRFKQVLQSNNRALGSITDIGEKLGGDYLFDIVYLRQAYDGLKRDMEASLGAFDVLTERAYPELRRVFDHLDMLIEAAVQDTAPVEGRLVLALQDVSWGSARTVGGKMAHLAELRNQAGLSVPDGFVITAAAYDRFLAYNGLDDIVRSLRNDPENEGAAEELVERILQGALPPDLTAALDAALHAMNSAPKAMLSVRSSAEDEDGERSFAGQFTTVLGVPAEAVRIGQAYRQVVASLFGAKACSYFRQNGYTPGAVRMAVGCMAMVDASASGVLYTTAPQGDPGTAMISAGWGLGEAVVEGRAASDLFVVAKGPAPVPVNTRIMPKRSMLRAAASGGTMEEAVPDPLVHRACLSPDQVAALTQAGMAAERYFAAPQDIEWAIDGAGKVWILQSRRLSMAVSEQAGTERPVSVPGKHSIAAGGSVVQEGTASGRVFIAKLPSDITAMPRGAVLVAPYDSSLFVRIMPFVSGIITESGSPASHMAALCRELKVPAVVGLADATRILREGQEITLMAVGDRATVYDGILPEAAAGATDRRRMDELFEFRRKRTILRYLTPLHLIDPLMDEFTPERCRSLHDMLRFMHEKAVSELVEAGRAVRADRRSTVVPLDLPIPAGMLVMDLGGGLTPGTRRVNATFDRIASVPFKALVAGMLRPGAWHAEAVSLAAGDLLSSMVRMPDITLASTSTTGYNIAVISPEYVNMSMRFGYHFNMIDCFCSEQAKNNHIYFRFAGGATDLVKRSRRLDLIGRILSEQGFGVQIKGDLLTARLAGVGREELIPLLERIGALVSYARQLDAVLRDDRDVEQLARRFVDGNYRIG